MNADADAGSAPFEPPPVRQVSPGRILRWITLGWQDLVRAGWPSLLHGLIVFIASIAIVEIAFLYWPLMPGAMSGFVLIGPILATGLYALSQRLEDNQEPTLRDVVAGWRRGSKCLMRFGLVLVLAGSAWVAVTALLFHFFVEADINEPKAFLHYVFVQQDLHFLLWAILGGLGAALVFGLSVVSIPLLIDRDINMPNAMLSSMRAVGENPVTMTCWAVFILIATGLSVLTLMFGFIVLYPLMGHASWHVYRDLIDADQLAPREI